MLKSVFSWGASLISLLALALCFAAVTVQPTVQVGFATMEAEHSFSFSPGDVVSTAKVDPLSFDTKLDPTIKDLYTGSAATGHDRLFGVTGESTQADEPVAHNAASATSGVSPSTGIVGSGIG